jgi:outer membrane protein assembly factor BamB
VTARGIGGFAVRLALVASAFAATGCELVRTMANPELPFWTCEQRAERRDPCRRFASLGRAWTRELTQAGRKPDPPYELGRPEIDAAHRRVFVGSSDRRLYALRAEDGSALWSFETLGPVQSEPLYDPTEDVVYFGSNDGALYKLRAVDGSLVFRFDTRGEVRRRPALENGVLYFVNASDSLFAADAATGKMKWYQPRTPAFGMEVAAYAGPALGTRFVYVSYSDGLVMAYDKQNGAEMWPTVDLAAEAEQITGETPRYLDVDATPVMGRIDGDEVVFVASYAGGVFALDALDGSIVWNNPAARGATELTWWSQPEHEPRDTPSQADVSVVAGRELLLATSSATGLWALDPKKGATVWNRDLPSGGMSAPVSLAGALLLATQRHGVFLLYPLTGEPIDAIDLGGTVSGSPAAHGRRAFLPTNGGLLVSLDVSPPEIARIPRRKPASPAPAAP